MSSAARSSSPLIRPAAASSRAWSRPGGRSRLPTWSLGLQHQGPGDRHALGLPAGQLPRMPPASPGCRKFPDRRPAARDARPAVVGQGSTDEAERAAERLDPVAVAGGHWHAARSRRELLVAEQVQRLAAPGHLLQVPRYAQAADLTRRYPGPAGRAAGDHRRPGAGAGHAGRAGAVGGRVSAEGIDREVDPPGPGDELRRQDGLAANLSGGQRPGPRDRGAVRRHHPPHAKPRRQARLEPALPADLARHLVEEVQWVLAVGDLGADTLAVDGAEQRGGHAGPGHRLAVGGDGRPLGVVVVGRPGTGDRAYGRLGHAGYAPVRGGCVVGADEVQRVALVRARADHQRRAEHGVRDADLGTRGLGLGRGGLRGRGLRGRGQPEHGGQGGERYERSPDGSDRHEDPPSMRPGRAIGAARQRRVSVGRGN